MDPTPGTESHYRVVRYYPHFGHGIMEEVLAENLTIDEAERLASSQRDRIEGEDIVIQDQLIEGIEKDVIATRNDDEESPTRM